VLTFALILCIRAALLRRIGGYVQTIDAETSSAPEAKRKPGRPAREVSAGISNFPPGGNDVMSRMGRRISLKAKHADCDVCGGQRWTVLSDLAKTGALPVLPDTHWQLSHPLIAYVCIECCFVRLFSVGWLQKVEQVEAQQERFFAATSNRSAA